LISNVSGYRTSSPSFWRGKRLLILVNPASGNKDGVFLYQNVLKPMLLNSGIDEPVLVITKSSGHVKEFLISENLSQYSCIVLVGGDGLLHVVLNSLYIKAGNDSNYFKLLESLPLAIIPAGTSNGLTATLHIKNPFEATKRLIEGRPQPIDLIKINQNTNVYWDLGILCWAMAAEHDHYQERVLRWIPWKDIRELLAPLIVIYHNTKHQATLKFVPVPNQNQNSSPDTPSYYTSPSKLHNSSHNHFKIIKDSFTFVIVTNIPRASSNMVLSPDLRIDEGAMDMIVVRSTSWWETMKLFFKLNDGTFLESEKVELYKVSEMWLKPKESKLMAVSGEQIPCQKSYLQNFNRRAYIVS